MDRFDAMAVLLAVVEEGSLSAGARRLRSPLTTVSRTISDLERHLQVRLLVRTSRRVHLTEAGQAYAAASKRVLEQVNEAERIARGEYSMPRGELTITAPVVFGRRHVLPISLEFLAAHPAIDLGFVFLDRTVKITDDHIDVAFRIGHLADSALVAVRVGSVRRVVCASPAYLARKGIPREPDDLRDHDAVNLRAYPITQDWRFMQGAKHSDISVHARVSVNTAEAAIEAALAGAGVTRVLSYQVADEIRSGALHVVLEAFEPEPMPVSIVYPEQGMLPLKLRAYLDWSIPRLRERLAAL